MERYGYGPLRAEDVAEAADIEQQLFSKPWTKQNFLESLQQPDTIYLAAWENESGVLAGYCGCYQALDEGNITNVAVRPSMQRQGIARNLMLRMLQSGKQRGIQNFVLEVRISNHSAYSLYQSLGFQNVGVRKNFYTAPTEDAYIMVLQC